MINTTPKEYEESYLPRLIKEYDQSTEWLRLNGVGRVKNFTSIYIGTVINQLQENEKHFMTYESLAKYLNDAGLPSMINKLSVILTDIRSAIQTYQQIYQNALSMENWQPPMSFF